MEPLARRDRIALGAIVVGAFALRVLYILSQRRDVLFDYPVVDEERYVAMARELAQGRVEPRPWMQPPGVVYALALVFRLAGDALTAPRIVQAAVSAGSCALAFVVARRLFSKRVAFATAAILALHGVLVFESYELLPPTWVLAADLVMLWTLLIAGEKRSLASAGIAGLALGVSALFTPVVLPFAAIAALWLRDWKLVGAFIVGVALPIAPVMRGNYERGGEIVLVSTNGGVNFFIGNNARYEETLAVRPGEQWVRLMDAPRAAGITKPGAGSAFFVREGLAFWRAHPLDAIALYAHKLRLYFGGAELPRDTDIYAAREGSTLAALVSRGPPWFPDGILVPVALVGMVLCWRRARIPAAFVLAQALVVSAFFVTSRYRMPIVPVLAMFAAAGVERAISWSTKDRARALGIVVALALILDWPTREARTSYAAELDFYRGLAHLRYRRDSVAAIDFFRAAAARDPNDARIWWELGNALDASKRTDEAIDAWRHAGDRDPWDSRARRRIAVILGQRGDLDGAIAILETHVAARAREPAHYATDHMNLALLFARRGEYPRALDELRAASTADMRVFRTQIVPWTKTALDTQGIDDGAFWTALAAMLDDGQPDLAAQARRRVR